MDIAPLLNKSEELTDWIRATLHDLQVQGDIRARCALGCLDIALEHREAVVLLVTQKLYGSAFALLRSIFESYVRGVWLRRCAKDRDVVERFTRDKLKQDFNELIQAIEELKDFGLGILSRLKKQGWTAMNSYTHSGFQHVVRRMTPDTIEPNYHDDEIEEVLNCANALGLLCIFEMAFLSTNAQLPMSVLEKTQEFTDGPGPPSPTS